MGSVEAEVYYDVHVGNISHDNKDVCNNSDMNKYDTVMILSIMMFMMINSIYMMYIVIIMMMSMMLIMTSNLMFSSPPFWGNSDDIHENYDDEDNYDVETITALMMI